MTGNSHEAVGSAPAPSPARDPLSLRLTRGGFRVLSRLAPDWTAGPASSLFLKPPRKRAGGEEAALLATGERRDVAAVGLRLATWSWGVGPTVLMVHGWGGRGSQLIGFVAPLVDAGYRCVLFDGPAHGASPGDRSNLVEFGRVVEELGGAIGGVDAVIAHSMGSVAAALALEAGMAMRRAVFVAPPEDMEYFSRVFCRRLGLSERTRKALQDRIEHRIRRPWETLRARSIAERVATPLLVMHDRDDADVPWSHGDTWAAEWRGATMITTTGLGHKGILRDPTAIETAVRFVASSSSV